MSPAGAGVPPSWPPPQRGEVGAELLAEWCPGHWKEPD